MKKKFFIIFLIIVTLLICTNVLSMLNLSFFGIRIFRVGSGSMEPYLNIRDLVIIKSSNDYNINDVVTYKKDGEYITHRIVSINGDEVITKGDANDTPDVPFSRDAIVGKLIYKFKALGFIDYLFSRKLTLVIFFVVGLVITMLIPDDNERMRKRYEEKKKIEKEIRYFSFYLCNLFYLLLYINNII